MALTKDGTPDPLGKKEASPEITDLREQANDQQERGLWGDEALRINQALFDLEPNDTETAVRLGRCVQAAGRPCDALELFDRVLAADPGDPVALELRGAAAANCELEREVHRLDAEGGLDAIREAAAAARRSQRDLHFRVLAHQFIVDREPTATSVGQLAAAVHDKGDLHTAETIFRRSLDLDPDPTTNAESMLAYARMLREQSRWDDALSVCDQILAARPEDVPALKLITEVICDMADSGRDHQRLTEANGYADRIWVQGVQDESVTALYERMKQIHARLAYAQIRKRP